MHYYQHHVGDYTKDTLGLSMLEDGAYRRLLDHYYTSEAPLPLNESELFRLARAVTAAEKKAVKYVIQKYFVANPVAGGWTQKRCDKELSRHKERSKSAKAAAAERWARRNASAMQTHSASNADAMQTHSEGNANHKPITINQELHAQPPLRGALESQPDDPKKRMFDLGVSILVANGGSSESGARSLLAKLAKEVGDGAVSEKLGYLAAHPKVEPRSYLIESCRVKTPQEVVNEKMRYMP